MQRSSETIGTIAAALAKAQAQLVNPLGSNQRSRAVLSLCPAVERARYRAQDPEPARNRHRADHLD
jgi:hypothetical protein